VGPARSAVGSVARLAERHVGWVLAACAFLVAAALTRPDFDSVDAQSMGQVAEGILHHGTPLVALHLPGHEMQEFHITGKYSSYGLGMSVLWVPFLALEQALGLPVLRLVALVSPLLLAATVLVMFTLSTTLGATRRRACAVTVALGFGTFLLTYGTTYYSEPAVALCVAVGLLGLARLDRSALWAGWVGGAIGFSVILRTDSLPTVALPIGCALLVLRPPRRHLATAGVVALPLLVAWGWYNVARFGSLTSLGYTSSGQGFNHSFVDGLVGLLVSPGKGIVWFAPILILTLWSMAGAYRRWPVLSVLALALIASRFLLYASWWGWDGGLSFGPRFIEPAIPAFTVLLTALVLDRGRDARFVRWGAALVTLGATVALVGSFSFGSWGTDAPAGSWKSNPVVIVVRAHLPER
jgi:hypothetical protein